MSWFANQGPRFRNTAKYAYRLSIGMASWVPVMIVLNEHVCYFGKIEGSSMQPTFNPSVRQQDWVLLWKWGVRDPGRLQVDDVVLFRSPQDPEKVLCKRVKGVQGDNVFTRHPYPREQCHIPRNHVWVEGDNIHSIDSNTFGPISTGLVLGKATSIIYPFSRSGSVPKGGREARVSRLAAYE
ncbi:CYFA0S02e10176g1_1 [Cyberlindnera fabianii]|uniref:Mitochondrial inner membrane protease subunit 2 n=1 Tax=Cyberlindnera fabianii TaxID=36022 RepID=A0A061AUI4_CYBFA|nr:CYFA0S02e10176g1_1 [Cyberlindnera fabianii]